MKGYPLHPHRQACRLTAPELYAHAARHRSAPWRQIGALEGLDVWTGDFVREAVLRFATEFEQPFPRRLE